VTHAAHSDHGTIRAELRKVLRTIGAAVLDSGLAVGAAHRAFTSDGRLRDPRPAASLCSVVGGLGRQTLEAAA
jgi:hypothetical protein